MKYLFVPVLALSSFGCDFRPPCVKGHEELTTTTVYNPILKTSIPHVRTVFVCDERCTDDHEEDKCVQYFNKKGEK